MADAELFLFAATATIRMKGGGGGGIVFCSERHVVKKVLLWLCGVSQRSLADQKRFYCSIILLFLRLRFICILVSRLCSVGQYLTRERTRYGWMRRNSNSSTGFHPDDLILASKKKAGGSSHLENTILPFGFFVVSFS